MTTRTSTSHRDLPFHAVFTYAALTFAITWSVIGAYIVFPVQSVAMFGEISGGHPLFFLATWAPAISAFLLIGLYGGLDGVRAFLTRLLLWRCGGLWWPFILLGIPAVFMVGSLIKGGPLIAPLPPDGAVPVFGLMIMMLFLGPMEEFGWRGVAQPLLQRRFAPFWTGAIIGSVWGLWHLPAFYLAGVVFAEWSFLPFFIGNVTLAILVTPMFNKARGSLLLPMLFHWQLINPFWPDAQPWDTWILVAIAALVVWFRRDSLFVRELAVTQVIPRERAVQP